MIDNKIVIFTGLIRNELKFSTFLNNFINISSDIRPLLIMSTWVGELEKYPNIKNILLKLGAIIIEQNQPNLKLPGHTLHQILALDSALAFIDQDSLIYKSRPDFADFNSFEKFFKSNPTLINDKIFSSIYYAGKNKITGFFLAQPLYINDITYSGISKDILKIIELPFLTMTRYHRMAPEQLLWAGNVIGRSRIFDNFFRLNFGLIFDDKNKSNTYVDLLKNFDLYIHSLALYIIYLDCLFETFNDFSDAEAKIIKDKSLEDLLWGQFQCPNVFHHPTAHTNSYQSMAVIKFIMSGDFKTTKFGDSVFNVIQKMLRLKDPENYLPANLSSISQSFTRKMSNIGLVGLKIFDEKSNNEFVLPNSADWAQYQSDNPVTVKMENEINYLRRINNELQEQLQRNKK